MDTYFTQVCLWTTLLAVVLTWAIFYVSNRRKKTTKLVDTAAQERRDGGPDVIIVGAGVGGSALAYALAKVIKNGLTVNRQVLYQHHTFVNYFLLYLYVNSRIIIFYTIYLHWN